MSQSLSNLVDNLAELNTDLLAQVLIHRFYNTYPMLSDNNIEKRKLLMRKGVYPYEYMRSWENFKRACAFKKIVTIVKLIIQIHLMMISNM